MIYRPPIETRVRTVSPPDSISYLVISSSLPSLQSLGRPLLVHNGDPVSLAVYSPVSAKRWETFSRQVERFIERGCKVFFLTLPTLTSWRQDFGANPFWVGDTISSTPLGASTASLDEMASFILERQPEAKWFIRFNPTEPKSWLDLHPDECFRCEDGERLPAASMASRCYRQMVVKFGKAVVTHCQSHSWADRIIGYWYGPEQEGTPLNINRHWLYDQSECMLQEWREFLHRRYPSDAALARAYGDPCATRDTLPLPTDPLRKPLPEVARLPFWMNAVENRPLRDYLALLGELFARHTADVTEAMQTVLEPGQVLLYDMLKLPMQGWSISGFFDAAVHWPLHAPETMAGSGHRHVSKILELPGISGLVTPHDYQRRGPGGPYEPEGLADSTILRGKIFMVEMDIRSWNGSDRHCPAQTVEEWASLSWRNLAASWTRGLQTYWMDVFEDWFAPESIQRILKDQIRVCEIIPDIPHETVPGIAVILDDTAVSETNGSGAFHHEAVMWEIRGGLAQCGVPYRIYTLEDLELESFPDHHVFYFPNLFRVDAARQALLERVVFRNGNVVVWGPGSGISDGNTVSPAHAERLTGFTFDWEPTNFPRRVAIADYNHPVTRHLAPGTLLSSPLAYGPCLYPKSGKRLGEALAKGGRRYGGLAADARGAGPGRTPEKGRGDYGAVFTAALPLPPQFWQGVTRWAGGHVYEEGGGVIMASRHLLGLHWQGAGMKTISLPQPATVYDLIEDRLLGYEMQTISFHGAATGTRLFQLRDPAMR